MDAVEILNFSTSNSPFELLRMIFLPLNLPSSIGVKRIRSSVDFETELTRSETLYSRHEFEIYFNETWRFYLILRLQTGVKSNVLDRCVGDFVH